MIRQVRGLKLLAAAVIAVGLATTDLLAAPRPLLHASALHEAAVASSKAVGAFRQWLGAISTWGARTEYRFLDDWAVVSPSPPPPSPAGPNSRNKPRALLRADDLWR
jgi:hypothetical protein